MLMHRGNQHRARESITSRVMDQPVGPENSSISGVQPARVGQVHVAQFLRLLQVEVRPSLGEHEPAVVEFGCGTLGQIPVAQFLAGEAEVGVHPLRMVVVGAEHQGQRELGRLAVGGDPPAFDPAAGVVHPFVEDEHVADLRLPRQGMRFSASVNR